MEIDGVQLNFQIHGVGPPVVLIHGASGNLCDMTFRLAPVLARDHTVVVFDRPGHGHSDWPAEGGASLSAQAALMRGVLRRLGIEGATLVGHGYGGSVALAWSIDAPESISGLVLLAAPSQAWFGGLGPMTEILANPVTGPLVAHIAPRFMTRAFVAAAAAAVFTPKPVPLGYLDHVGLDLLLQPRSLRANALQMSALKAQLREMMPAYARLSIPVEILHGIADHAVPLHSQSAILATQIRHCRLTRLERVGHMIHQIEPDAVKAALWRLPDMGRCRIFAAEP